MDVAAVSLLYQAREAGLTLRVDDGVLVVRGPKRCEPLARQLLARKPEIVELLGSDQTTLPWDQNVADAWIGVALAIYVHQVYRLDAHLCKTHRDEATNLPKYYACFSGSRP